MMLELNNTEMIKFPNSNTSAESIHIVKTLVKFVKADMNQVRGDTDSAFFARSIANNWTILLEAEIGVHIGARSVSTIFGTISNSKQALSVKYITAHKKDQVLILFKYFSTRNISIYSCVNIIGYSRYDRTEYPFV